VRARVHVSVESVARRDLGRDFGRFLGRGGRGRGRVVVGTVFVGV